MLLRKGFDVVFNTPVSTFKSFEYIDLTVSSKTSSIRLFVIYRPPPSKVNKLTPTMFFDEFQGLIEMIAPLPTTTVIVGDFNFHLDDLEDHDANMMRDILESASMNQCVDGPTHKKGHTLDLIITRRSDPADHEHSH